MIGMNLEEAREPMIPVSNIHPQTRGLKPTPIVHWQELTLIEEVAMGM